MDLFDDLPPPPEAAHTPIAPGAKLSLHGDVVVWGGPARLAYHGVMPLAEGEHGLLGRCM